MTDALQRMRELAVQAQNGSNGTSDRANLDTEYQQLSAEITRIATQTKFNGKAIVGAGAGAQTFQVGANNGDTLTVTTVAVTDGRRRHARRRRNASTALAAIDAKLDVITTNRATYGAAMSRFGFAISNLQITGENQSAARGRIMDADFAAETAEPVARPDPAAGRHGDGGAGQPAAADGARAAAQLSLGTASRSRRRSPLKSGGNGRDRCIGRRDRQRMFEMKARPWTISSAGIGSGLDVNSIVTQLMAIEQQPLTALQTKATTIQTTVSEYGKIKSAVSTLRDLAGKLASIDDLGPDDHQLVEHRGLGHDQQLRAPARTRSKCRRWPACRRSPPAPPCRRRRRRARARCTSSSAATGRRPDRVHAEGRRHGGRHRRDRDRHARRRARQDQRRRRRRHRAGHDRRERLAPADPLQHLRRRRNAFRTSGIASLAFDPSAGVTTMTQSQTAADAAATVNGLAVTSPQQHALQHRRRPDPQPVGADDRRRSTVNVVTDTEALKKTITDFAAAYTARRQADRDRHQVRRRRPRRAASCRATAPRPACSGSCARWPAPSSGASALFGHLSDAGLELQGDGSMTVNATKLANALGNLRRAEEAVRELRPARSRRRTASASAFASSPTRMLGVDGALTTRTDGLGQQLQRNQKDQDALQRPPRRHREAHARPVHGARRGDGAAQQQSSYITQQIAAFNANSSSK